jgi:hypothetical protein
MLDGNVAVTHRLQEFAAEDEDDRLLIVEGDEEVEDGSQIENDEGWIDEVELLAGEEHDELEEAILPLKLALMKVIVHHLTYCQADLI